MSIQSPSRVAPVRRIFAGGAVWLLLALLLAPGCISVASACCHQQTQSSACCAGSAGMPMGAMVRSAMNSPDGTWFLNTPSYTILLEKCPGTLLSEPAQYAAAGERRILPKLDTQSNRLIRSKFGAPAGTPPSIGNVERVPPNLPFDPISVSLRI
jgi:hypothetical protein